jgi:hypothetical protein
MENILFIEYFNVADEIGGFGIPEDELLTLKDFKPKYIAKVKKWAERNYAPWPPNFEWAEENWDHQHKML